MKQTATLLSAVLSLALLSACGSNPKQADAGTGTGTDGGGVVTDGTGDINVTGTEADEAGSIGNRAPLDRVIYFDFDKSEIRAEYLDIVAQHGRFLAQNPEGRVRLEGHTDERGDSRVQHCSG